MKRKIVTVLLIGLCATVSAQILPYQNPQLSAEQRADDLLGRLTLEEKTKLMMDVSPAIPRLGIPEFHWWNEALHGIGRNGIATVFPITMGMAATFNDHLVYQAFTAASDEARAKNTEARRKNELIRYRGLSFWTPNINIFRDPRWGRGQETYGEDPYLTSKMGLAVVNGLQGQAYNQNNRNTQKNPYTVDRNGTAMSSTLNSCPNVTYGRPTCPLLRHWCKKVTSRRLCVPTRPLTESPVAVIRAICNVFCETNGGSRVS